MNADIRGMYEYYISHGKKKSMRNLIVANNGYTLTSQEARAYIAYCYKNGYKDMFSCPEFEEIKDKLQNV